MLGEVGAPAGGLGEGWEGGHPHGAWEWAAARRGPFMYVCMYVCITYQIGYYIAVFANVLNTSSTIIVFPTQNIAFYAKSVSRNKKPLWALTTHNNGLDI